MIGADVQTIRSAIINALPDDTSLHGQAPEPRHVYVPPSHAKALRLDASLVIGGRGVGKSFWSAALADESVRALLSQEVRDFPSIQVYRGYSETPSIKNYPDRATFSDLLRKKVHARDVWRAVIARWTASVAAKEIPINSWPETAAWVAGNPESFAHLLEAADNKLQSINMNGLIVFDALDRTSENWVEMDDIVRNLLKTILELRPFKNLHGKIFLREDQFSSRRVTDFPDASKLLSTRVELTWSIQELHGLLWQYLCNPHNEIDNSLVVIYRKALPNYPLKDIEGVQTLPDIVKRNEDLQKKLFEALAGDKMGKDRRRGIPYSWSVGHLADARARVSPRSFLSEIRAAADDSSQRYPDHNYPLHYESIKRGVQQASQIRVAELAEDYPWISDLMRPLSGLNVPCSFDQIEERWGDSQESLLSNLITSRLPPEHIEEGWSGVRRDLEALGVFDPMKDKRVNMPDLYRVGFGLGRRGGVKPPPKLAQE